MGDSTCLITGCNKRVLARGWCAAHYQRWRNHGSPTGGARYLGPAASDTCVQCGTVLPAKPATGPRASYCSKSCRSSASYARRKSAGTVKARARKAREAGTCDDCGILFVKVRVDSRFCSSRCYNRWLDRENPNRCSALDCDEGVRAKGLCAKHWRRIARAEGRERPVAWTSHRRELWQARNALKRGAPIADRVVNAEIFDRDGWVCQLCHAPVDQILMHPDPMSKSLDHVVPLSRGGAHSPDNVQLAHLSCNVRKGARVEVQMR